MSEEQVQKLSTQLPKALAPIMETEEDNFSVEHIPAKFYKNGSLDSADPFLEVLWFERSQKIQDESAEKITALVRGFATFEYITIVFTALKPSAYYENAKYF